MAYYTKKEAEELLIGAAIALKRVMDSGITTEGLVQHRQMHRQMVKTIERDYPHLYKSIIHLMNRVDSYDTACFYERHPEHAPKRN